MSSEVLVREAKSAIGPKPRSGSSVLCVNQPGDTYEREADHVAETVARGGHVASWSLSALSLDTVQRQTATPPGQPTPEPQPTGDIIPKVAEALMATKAGKEALQAIKGDPLVKGATDFVTTPAGIVIAGSAAVGIVSTLAATHKPLPLQIPKLPLDKPHPGLAVKITYEGPVNKPTSASLTLSFEPKAPSQKPKQTEAERFRAETARMAAEQQRFREGLHLDSPQGAASSPEQGMVERWTLSRLSTIGQVPRKMGPAAGGPPAPETALRLPTFQSPLKPKAPSLLDKKLELKPTTTSVPHEEAKKEETPIQRKEEPGSELTADSAGVEAVLRSQGHPLDSATRRCMETRIGFDFSKVRVHTDDQAAASARSLGARAYTVGSDVVFAAGRYTPETPAGRRLIGHELTHVVQQSQSIARRPTGISSAPARIQREEDDKSPSLWSDPKGWALAHLKKIPGYDLFCTIIGKDLVTWQDKDHSPGAVLREILKLVHGEEAYDRVVASGALEKAWAWVSEELDKRNLNLGYFKGLINQAIDSISLGDLKDIPGAVERIIGIFRPAYDKVVDFASAAFHKLFEIAVQVVMEKFGDLGQKVMAVLTKVGSTFLAIASDPVKFVGNLVKAIQLGFTNFAQNFLKHLQDSLMEFLFGELGSKIKPPKEFSLSAIFNLILDVLDLHYEKFRERLVEKTSPETASFLESSYDFIMKLANAKSLAGAWDIFKQRASDLIDELVTSAIDAIKNWVVTKVVQAAVKKIVELFTPASAIVAAIEAIYHTIVFLIEKAKQLAAVLEAVTNSISLIAEGNLTQAADWVERSMAKAFAFILAFFAEQAGLGGIGETIRGIITKVRDKVWAAIDKVLDYVISKTKNFAARGKAAVGKALTWWQQRKDLLIGDEPHAVYMEGSEDAPKVMISSEPISWAEYTSKLKPKGGQKKLLDETVKLVAELEKPLDKKKSAGENSEQVTRKRTLFQNVCDNIVKLGFQKEAPPISQIEFDKSLAPGDGGTRATAKVLSSLHEAGSEPSDDADIWKNLGSLVREKKYVQGHLLNHNLGGPGLRYNLTPINRKANARHHAIVEKDIKRMVLQEKKVVFYEVKAVYGTHPAKPKPMVKLEAAKDKGALPPPEEKKLQEYQAEQKLALGLEYSAHELQRTPENKWEKVNSTEVSGGIPNQLDLDK